MPISRTIYGDGKRYEFTPGENGSLTATQLNPAPAAAMPAPRPRAKVIGPNMNKGADQMMTNNDDMMKEQLLQELIEQMDQRDAKRLPGMEEMATEEPPMEGEGEMPMDGGGSPDLSSMDPRLLELLKSRMGA